MKHATTKLTPRFAVAARRTNSLPYRKGSPGRVSIRIAVEEAAKDGAKEEAARQQERLETFARKKSDIATLPEFAENAEKLKEGEHDQTALMWAAAQRHPKVVELLVEFGADIRARSRIYPQVVVGEQTQRAGREALNYTVQRGGSTALLFAARVGDVESARILLEHGGGGLHGVGYDNWRGLKSKILRKAERNFDQG